MAGTDTYQLILQLRDELSAGLKDIKANLNQTKAAGQQAAGGIKTVAAEVKKAVSPIKAFNSIMKTMMGLGGAMYVFNRVAKAVGEMEAAFEKANPSIKAMEGSAFQFKAAVDESKSAMGELIYEIVSPARSVIIQTIQDATDSLKEMNDEADTVGETLGQVGVYTVKVFQTVGRLIFDNFNLMKVTFKALWELVKSVGEFIWLPLKKGFLLIIQPIKKAFLDMVNWILQATTDMVNWVGKMLMGLTGGKIGGGMAGWSAGQIEMKDLAPDSVKLKTWDEMMGEVKDTFGYVGDELNKVLNAYVDIWTRKPGESRLYDVPPDKDGTKEKTLNEILKGMQSATYGWDAQDYMDAMDNVVANGLIVADNSNRELQIDEEVLKLMRDERRERALAAQSFITDPMAGIGQILQDAFEGASSNLSLAGDPIAMISEFFSLAIGGLETMLASLAEFLPIILLVAGLMEIFTGIQEILGPIVGNMLEPFIGFLQGIGNVIGTLLLPIFQAFEPALYAIGILLNGLLPLFQLLVPVFQAIGFVIKLLLIPFIGFVQLIVGFINLIIKGWNAVNNLWAGKDIPLIKVPEMPTFHKGGTANEDMVALLKKGEVVLNPYKSKAYVAGGGAGGGITINAPNARYIDKTLAGELVRMGLAGMRA